MILPSNLRAANLDQVAARMAVVCLVVSVFAAGCSGANKQASDSAVSQNPSVEAQQATPAKETGRTGLPDPLPTLDNKAATEDSPARQAPGCKRNEAGELENPRSYPYKLNAGDSALTRSVVTADIDALSRSVADEPGVAARDENGWLLSYVLEHGCFDIARKLVDSGAPVVYTGSKRAAQARTLPLLMDYANLSLFQDFLPKALKSDVEKSRVWSDVFQGLCSAPTSFWPVLKENNAPITSADGARHPESSSYKPQPWVSLLNCESKEMLRTVFADLGEDRPSEALVTFVDELCVNENEPPRDAMPPELAADTIWTLRGMGYEVEEEVDYVSRRGDKRRGSALSVSQGKKCSPQVAYALGWAGPPPG